MEEKKKRQKRGFVDVCVFALGQISAAQALQCRGGGRGRPHPAGLTANE